MGVLAVIGARIIGVFRTDFGQVLQKMAQVNRNHRLGAHTKTGINDARYTCCFNSVMAFAQIPCFAGYCVAACG